MSEPLIHAAGSYFTHRGSRLTGEQGVDLVFEGEVTLASEAIQELARSLLNGGVLGTQPDSQNPRGMFC